MVSRGNMASELFDIALGFGKAVGERLGDGFGPEHFLRDLFVASDAPASSGASGGETVLASAGGGSVESAASSVIGERDLTELRHWSGSFGSYLSYIESDINDMLREAYRPQQSIAGVSVVAENGAELMDNQRAELARHIAQLEDAARNLDRLASVPEADRVRYVQMLSQQAGTAQFELSQDAKDIVKLQNRVSSPTLTAYHKWKSS